MNTTPFEITGFKQGEVLLNLSGYHDGDECVVQRVTVAGSDENLVDLLEVSVVCDMADRAELQLLEQARQEKQEARIERHQWHKEFRVAA